MQQIETELKNFLSGASRVVIIGVGSELRGDDAAGVLAASRLREELKNKGDKITVLTGGSAPENLTGEIKKFNPSHIVVIDAADSGRRPGKIALLKPQEIGGDAFSTHRISTRMLADYLRQSLDCEIIVLGIQPGSVAFGKKLSKKVETSVKLISKMFWR